MVGHSSSTRSVNFPTDSEAIVWDVSSGITSLGFLGSLTNPTVSAATGASADGSIVAGTTAFNIFLPSNRAARWVDREGAVSIGTLPNAGFPLSEGRAISDSGSRVVGISTSSVGLRAYLWPGAGDLISLGVVEAGTAGASSEANGISGDGSVIVGSWTLQNGTLGDEPDDLPVITDTETQAFRWTSAEGMIGLGDLPGGPMESNAVAASTDGSVIVGHGTPSDTSTEGVIWADGIMTSVGDLPGGENVSRLLDVTGDGSTAVGFGTDEDGMKAVIWDETNGLRTVLSLATDLGVDLTGWQLTSATGISADGNVIVGNGINPAGDIEGWVFIIDPPPIPPSITSQPLATQIIGANSSTTLTVSASGPDLTFQWFQGLPGDVSIPVGENSPSFTTPPLTEGTTYWVRVSNSVTSVDSTEATIIIFPQELRIGDALSIDLSGLLVDGRTLRLNGRLPTGLRFDTRTGLLSGLIRGRPGDFSTEFQVLENRTLVQAIPVTISVDEFPQSLLGDYEALLRNSEGAPLGFMEITIGINRWSATLATLGQSSRRARGTFELQQGSPAVNLDIIFPSSRSAPALTINLTLDGESPTFTGDHALGTFEGFKIISVLENAPRRGAPYGFIFDQGTTDGFNEPAGWGWAAGTFSSRGTGRFRGVLGDGTRCSINLSISTTGQAILWVQPYREANSFIAGVIDLTDIFPYSSEGESLENRTTWTKLPETATKSYPNGFSFPDVAVIGSAFAPASTHEELGASLGWLNNVTTTVRIAGAGISNEQQVGPLQLPTEFTIDRSFRLLTTAPTDVPTLRWSGRVTRNTGAVAGTLTFTDEFSPAVPSGRGTVSGLLLQNEAWGITTGLGHVRVPTNDVRGGFRTAGIIFEQPE